MANPSSRLRLVLSAGENSRHDGHSRIRPGMVKESKTCQTQWNTLDVMRSDTTGEQNNAETGISSVIKLPLSLRQIGNPNRAIVGYSIETICEPNSVLSGERDLVVQIYSAEIT